MKNVIKFPVKVLKPIRDYLLATQKRLVRRRRNIIAEDPFSDTSRVNDNAASDTDAAEVSGHYRAEALRNEVDRGLITIRRALTKIRLGKYGLCEKCGKMIDTDRLAVNPAAELCMKCEKKRKQ